MLEIPLIVRPVIGYNYDYFPGTELAALYRIADINLLISLQSAVRLDPDDPRHVRRLLQNVAPRSGEFLPHPAVLLIGNRHPQSIANGRLVDLKRRGIAVVYQNSPYIKSRDVEGVFEVCAHEIGHLLNLTHEHARSRDITVMDVSDTRRLGDKPEAWKNAFNVAGPNVRPAIRHFVESVKQQKYRTLGFPFSVTSRRRLSDPRFAHDTLPWSGPFADGSGAWDVAGSDALSIDLMPDHDHCHVGEPFSFLLHLRNVGNAPISIPDNVSPNFGGTKIHVERPNGRRFHARPTVTACALGGRDLAEGEELLIPVVLTEGPGGDFFSIPGRYRISGECGSLGLYIPPVEISVEPAETDATQSRAFRNFLCAGAPPHRRKQLTILDDILTRNVGKLSPLRRSYLAYRRLLTISDTDGRTKLREIVRTGTNGVALKMTAMLEDIARLAREKDWKTINAEIKAARDALPTNGTARWFFEVAEAHAEEAVDEGSAMKWLGDNTA